MDADCLRRESVQLDTVVGSFADNIRIGTRDYIIILLEHIFTCGQRFASGTTLLAAGCAGPSDGKVARVI
jgi:hypothetical protein